MLLIRDTFGFIHSITVDYSLTVEIYGGADIHGNPVQYALGLELHTRDDNGEFPPLIPLATGTREECIAELDYLWEKLNKQAFQEGACRVNMMGKY